MKKLLIVVDYQKDFVDGALGFSGAELLDAAICAKIEACRAEGADVLFTLDTHSHGYLETQEGRNLPVVHCISGSEGWALYGKVASMPRPEDQIVQKLAFGTLEMAEYLKDKDYREIELVGLTSNICVLCNAVLAKSALPEARIMVDAACTGSYDPDLHEKALDVMEGLQIGVLNRRIS